jgi:tetratricopeptide (TPR) repeat protein
VSDPIFERYKEALKQGHVAVLRGRHKEALEHYRIAVEIADERPLPHTSLGGVLLRLGRTDEALAAYARALGRAPRDEGALSGRAEALLVAGRQEEAAEVLERLAEVLAATGREPEAVVILRRALELVETKRRRKRYVQLARALRLEGDDRLAAADAVADEELDEEADATLVPADAPAAADVPVTADGPVAADGAQAAEAGALSEASAGVPGAAASEPTEPETPAPVADGGVASAPDPDALLAEADAAEYQGRVADGVAAYAAAAAAYLAANAPDAALDVCQQALRMAPDAPAVHLMLARVYLARGWNERAVEKLVLLARLLELDDATDARAELSALASDYAAAEPRLAQLALPPQPSTAPEASPPPAS